MKIIWLSANIFGFKILEHIQGFAPGTITEIITLADDSKTVMYDGVRQTDWHKFDIPVHYVGNSVGLEKIVISLSPDMIFMCGWRQMIPDSILSLPKKGVIGFHPTLLPKGRGPAPIINTILAGWKESGLTMFYVSSLVDAGDIIGQETFVVGDQDNSEVIYSKVINAGFVLIERFLPNLLNGTAPRIPQKDENALYFPKLNLRDNEILPTDSIETMYRKVKALSWPYKGAFIRKGDKRLVILAAKIENEKER